MTRGEHGQEEKARRDGYSLGYQAAIRRFEGKPPFLYRRVALAQEAVRDAVDRLGSLPELRAVHDVLSAVLDALPKHDLAESSSPDREGPSDV